MTFLKVSKVSKKGDSNLILKNISFTQRRYQKIAIAGETGSGKSTLLKIIAGLVESDKGSVFLEDQKIAQQDALVPGHAAIAYLSQDFELPKFLRVEQVLRYANKQSHEESLRLYEVCRISHLLNRKTDELSGGERQRIALARMLAASPKIILLDEPFSNLDRVHKVLLKAVIEDMGRRLDMSCILISHEPEDLLAWADLIILLKDGRVVQRGTPEKLYWHPSNEYVAGLLGKYTAIDPRDKTLSKFIKPAFRHAKWYARPEQASLVKRNKGLPGTVVKTSFMGDHYELEVQCGHLTAIVRANDLVKTAGDRVYVTFYDSRAKGIRRTAKIIQNRY